MTWEYDHVWVTVTNNNTVQNDNPCLYIITPSINQECSGNVKISGNAWDDQGIEYVKIKIGENEYLALDISGNNSWYIWEYIWNTTGLEDGEYKISIIVFDGNNYGESQIELEINNTVSRDDLGVTSPKSKPGLMGFLPLVAGIMAVLVTFFGAISTGYEPSKYKLLSLFAVPLYVKRNHDKTLENFVRGQIFGFIQANPGTHYNYIKRALDLNNGTIAYHLNVLEQDEFIYSKTDRLYRRFYPKDPRIPPVNGNGNGDDIGIDPGNRGNMDFQYTHVQLNPTQDKIIMIIQQSPGMTQKEIANVLGISTQVVNYNINTMAQLGLVKLERVGNKTKCFTHAIYRVEDALGCQS